MESKAKYRENNYFNEQDTYLVLDLPGTHFVSGVHSYNGYWCFNKGLQQKATTMRCINLKELM